MAEKSKLKQLKEEYSKIQKKYNLPNFDKLNENFKIEKIAETETDFLIREVRESIGETLENFFKICRGYFKSSKCPNVFISNYKIFKC